MLLHPQHLAVPSALDLLPVVLDLVGDGVRDGTREGGEDPFLGYGGFDGEIADGGQLLVRIFAENIGAKDMDVHLLLPSVAAVHVNASCDAGQRTGTGRIDVRIEVFCGVGRTAAGHRRGVDGIVVAVTRGRAGPLADRVGVVLAMEGGSGLDSFLDLDDSRRCRRSETEIHLFVGRGRSARAASLSKVRRRRRLGKQWKSELRRRRRLGIHVMDRNAQPAGSLMTGRRGR